MKGVESGVRVITILAVQFSAGYFSYIIARKFWSLGMHPFHLEALEEECSADLTVTVIYGSLVEAGGCLAAKTAEVFLEEKIINEKHIIAIQAVVSGIITILGEIFLFCPMCKCDDLPILKRRNIDLLI